MDSALENYIKKSFNSKSGNKFELKIPMVYNFSYKDLYNFLQKLIPDKKINIRDSNISQSRYNLTYDFRVEIF